jgi:nucleotide-binding universal stress UspA family protein
MTKFDRKAVHYGVSLAKALGAELYLIHVLHDPFGTEGWNLPVPSLNEDYKREVRKAKEGLDRMVEQEKAGGLNVREIVKEGKPSDVILRTIEEEKIDLVILLAHEEGKLEHFLFGHTNDEIMSKIPCSVLFVKKEIRFG